MQDNTLWNSCLLFFEETLTPQQYNSWIKPLSFEVQGNQIILIAPNSFTLKIVQERFLPEIARQAELYLSCPPSFSLRVGDKPIDSLTAKSPALPTDEEPSSAPVSSVPLLSLNKHKNQSQLNPLLTFENFVTGKANQLAHAAAIQVAETPGTTYNPLFIYGGVGLGKTHLIQSIGNYIKQENRHAKICYVHATNYISDVVRAFQTKKI